MIKKYYLVLIAFLCLTVTGFGQVFENFDGFTSGGYNNYSYNNFDINNGLSETANARSGRAVRLRNTGTSNLEYVGVDGNGKDGGIGTISFWYRSWDASPTAEYDVEISINNGAYTTIGSQISTTSTTYSQWSHSLNNSSDNIKVRVIRSNGERLIIDDFEITDYSVAGPNITATPTTITGLDYSFGNGPSAPQSFDVEGTLLVAGTTVTSSSPNFEVSLTAVGGYGNSVNVPAGTLNGITTIYTRLVAGLAVNTYNSTITISNTTPGLGTTPTITVSGEVTPAPPANDDCSGAISLTPNASCTYTSYTNVNTTDSGVPDPSCSSYGGGDVWFSIVVPMSGEITIETSDNGGLSDTAMALYSGSCGSLTEIDCDDDSGSGTMSLINATGLSVGSTVYIRVFDYQGNNEGTFDICVTTPTPCTAPTNQPTDLTLSNITGSTIYGSFTATTADEYLVVVSTSSILGANPVNGVTYNNGNTIGSGTVVQSSNATTFTATGLSQTTQYYFFVFAYNDSSCAGGPAYNTTTPLTGDETTITGPCLEEDFSGWNHSYSNWTETTTDGTWTANSSFAGSNRIQLNGVGDWLELPPISNAQTLEYETALSSSSSGNQDGMIVQYFDGSSWTDIQQDYFTSTSYSTVTVSLPFPVSNGTNVRLRLYRSDDYRVQYINNIQVFCGTPCTPPADPIGTISSIDAPDFCETAELAFSGTAPTDIVYYWQTSPTDIDTTYDAANALDVTTDGDFYVRAYNTVTSCWSDNAVGPYTVTISNLPEITDQPDNINVANGGNATFSVTATNAVSYQWQVSTDGGSSWSNTGTDAPTLNVLGVNLSMLGNIYRVIVTNSCGDTLSDEAILFVYSGSPCIEEDFNSFPDAGWTNNGTINETTGVHSGASQPCRVFGTGDNIITSQTDYPTILEFYQDASSGGDGNIATVDYRIDAGSWMPLYSFSASETGRTELVDLTDVSGVNLGSQANVRFRFNSTFNSWYLDDVKVYCTPCTPPTITTSIDLSSGPIGTYVTISGSQLGTATVSFNSIALTPISQSANEIVVQVPANAVDGSFIIETNTIVCDTAFPFDVIDEELNCQSNITPAPTDLFIYELFDEDQNIDGSGGAWGNGGMITVYNGTLETKDLSDYRLYRTTDYTNTGSSPYSLWHSLSGTLDPGEVYRIWIDGSNCTDYATPYETEYIGFNANDGVELRKNNGSGSYITIDQLHTANIVGYHYVRDLTANNKPTASYDSNDWAFTDIFPSSPYCVGAGQAPDFEGDNPTISLGTPIATCSTYEITANAVEGYTGIYAPPADLHNLTFQWYYFDGVTDAWIPITTGGDFTVIDAITQSTLTVDNASNKLNYQFYCEVSEGSSCYTASEAIKIELNSTTWNGTTWSNNEPDANTIATIAGDYTTNASNGSFTACQLFVESGNLLTVAQGYFVEVINNVEVSGDGSGNDGIIIEDKGSFVQRGDGTAAGTFTLNTNGASKVNKRTAPLNNYYEYTYWSSPVLGETIGTGLAEGHPTRRYKYLGENYLDATMETNNNNATNPGQDDIDDNGDDWVFTPGTETMMPGKGYAAMHDPIGFTIVGGQYEYVFEGAFNTGDIDVTIYRNDSVSADNNWNFIGNPYPSAIDANEFLLVNSVIAQDVEEFPTGSGTTDGAIFLWSQSTAPSGTANGNENLNFAQSDYAIINATGQTAGGDNDNDGDIDIDDRPNRFIPSGQGFFISYSNTGAWDTVNGDIKSGTVSFTNSMRTNGNNDQFFRTGHSDTANRLWVNMWSDNGVRNQILVGYVPGASNELDGMYYDAPKNLSTDVNAMIYTNADNSDKKLAIQGKTPHSLDLDEVIPLGFYTAIPEATLYSISVETEGLFFEDNIVYLKDKLLNVYHDLSNTHYTFSSEMGEFNERFEIVFRTDALSVDEVIANSNQFQIIELDSDQVKFLLDSQNLTIKTVEIFDLLGRTIYRFNGSNRSETYSLSNLSSSAYMARVTLSNNQVIVKKAIKK